MSLEKLEDTDKAVPSGQCTALRAYITEQEREKIKPSSHLKMEIKIEWQSTPKESRRKETVRHKKASEGRRHAIKNSQSPTGLRPCGIGMGGGPRDRPPLHLWTPGIRPKEPCRSVGI